MSDDTFTKSNDSSSSIPRERHETFIVSGPVTARLTTRSGDVLTTQGDDTTVTVTLRATGSAAAHLLEHSEIRYDESNETLYVVSAGASDDARSGSAFGVGFGRRRSLFGDVTRDVDVFVSLPNASSVEVKTKSGDCVLHAAARDVEVSTASGDIVIDDASSIDARTASGVVMIGRSATSTTARTASGDILVKSPGTSTKAESASGDVHVLATGDDTNVSTASGDVSVGATGPGRLSVRSASGDIRLAVSPGIEIDVVARSVSGNMASAIPLDEANGGGSGEPLKVNVTTVSGDVQITRA